MESDVSVLKCRAFVEAARLGGFTKAAEAIGCSQSGVSRMISDLEKDWGIVLLERGRGGVRLTPEGERLLGYASALCAGCDDLVRTVRDIRGLGSGRIRIGTFSSVATHWLPHVISRFKADNPGIEYELLIGDYWEIEAWVREGRVDFGFTRLTDGTGLETTVLQRDELMAVVPEGHPLADSDTIRLEDLCKEPFLLLERCDRAEVSELLDRHGMRPDIRCTTWDDYSVMSMVEGGMGVSILPDLILRRIPYRIEKRHLDVPAYRDICIAMRSRELMPPAASRFLDYLRFRDSPAPESTDLDSIESGRDPLRPFPI